VRVCSPYIYILWASNCCNGCVIDDTADPLIPTGWALDYSERTALGSVLSSSAIATTMTVPGSMNQSLLEIPVSVCANSVEELFFDLRYRTLPGLVLSEKPSKRFYMDLQLLYSHSTSLTCVR
jgi:hypothetical protein